MRSKIFLAEDDHEARRFIADELAHDGWDVVTAADGTDALEALSNVSRRPWEMPDVIVMDIRMPGYSGLHVLAALRNAGWSVPIVLITAFGGEALHDGAKQLGAWAVLDKPFSMDDLRATLASVMTRH